MTSRPPPAASARWSRFSAISAPGGRASRSSAVAGHAQVNEALTLLDERFRDVEQDGPNAYAAFLATPEDEENRARLRREAVAAVREFLAGFTDTF